jgi:valyl-tRNA synthetase
MRLLHPFAPYVTEEIWQKLPKPPQLPGSLMITVFPRGDASYVDKQAEAEMKLVQDTAVGCRMLKATYGIAPAQSAMVGVRATGASATILERFKDAIERTARVKMTVAPTFDGNADFAKVSGKEVISSEVEIVMPLGDNIDPTAEAARIKKDIGKAEKEIAGLEKKLGNADFLARAPEDVVEEQKTRLSEEKARLQRLVDALAVLDSIVKAKA